MVEPLRLQLTADPVMVSSPLEPAAAKSPRERARMRRIAARTALAKHIVDMARQGERDSQRLVEGALVRLRLWLKDLFQLMQGTL
jgi:hypothetical protein